MSHEILKYNECNYYSEPVFPIISCKFAGISIDIQAGNFAAIDEVSILRFIILNSNPKIVEVNLLLYQWASKNNLLAKNWQARELKSFHFTSLLIFFCIQKNYLPVIYSCIDQTLFEGHGIVMLKESQALDQCLKCQQIPEDIDPKIIFEEFILYMENFNPEDKIDLLEGNVTKRIDKYDKDPYYSMFNFVTKMNMSHLFLNAKKHRESIQVVKKMQVAFGMEANKIRKLRERHAI